MNLFMLYFTIRIFLYPTHKALQREDAEKIFGLMLCGEDIAWKEVLLDKYKLVSSKVVSFHRPVQPKGGAASLHDTRLRMRVITTNEVLNNLL
jgi:hypothetical protein